MKLVGLCLCLVVAGAAAEMMSWESYVGKFNKFYTSAEEATYRRAVFGANMVQVAADNAAHMAAGGGAVFGATKFSDLTAAEFKAYKGYVPSPYHAIIKKYADTVEVSPRQAAKDVDWRKKGYVTAVKDQGQCGSCWAFSATEQTETDWIIAGNSKQVLAPQQVVSCDTIDAGCGGGDTPTAYHYIMKAGGLVTEKDYPYTSGRTEENGKCKQFPESDLVANITGFAYVSKSKSEETKMESYVGQTGPVSVCLATNGWQSYTGGVLKHNCGGAADVDHCVQVVGYSKSGSDSYWIVRNSWNTDWGIDGYIHVELGKNTCDIAGEATITKSK